jgi:putative endonuclease
MGDAISREKAIKLWPRQRKFDLIHEMNPKWRDLWDDLVGADLRSAVT